MKIFTFTGDTFAGHWEFEYDVNGFLARALNESKMEDKQYEWLSRHFPIHEHMLPTIITKTSRVTEITDLSFEMFWERFGNKQAKVNAQNAWKKLSKVEKIKAVEGITPYNYHLQINTHLTKMLPASYLNGKRFMDEWPHQQKARNRQ